MDSDSSSDMSVSDGDATPSRPDIIDRLIVDPARQRQAAAPSPPESSLTPSAPPARHADRRPPPSAPAKLQGGRSSDEPKVRAWRYFQQEVGDGDKVTAGRFRITEDGRMSRDLRPAEPEDMPCFYCGARGHDPGDCPNRLCFNCGQPGHMYRDCPNEAVSQHCLRCGMPECKCSGQGDWIRAEGGCERDYHWADKPLQRCYVCFQLGHLCCLSAPKKMKPSCYNCGESGHLGDDCQRTKTPKLCAERSGKGMDAVVDDYDTDRFSGRGRWEKDSRSPYGNEPRRRPSYYDRISQDPRASWSKTDHASLPSSRDSYHRDRSNSLGRWNSAPQGWVSGSSGGHRSSGLDSRPSQRYSADSRSGHHARKHNSSHRRTYE